MNATFEFILDGEIAKIVSEAIKPEKKRMIPRTKVEIKNRGKFLNLYIHANDINALRAGINSYLRWINEAVEISNEVSKWKCQKKFKTS